MALSRTNRVGAHSATSGNFGTGVYTTGSFTPSDNSLLVVMGMFIENGGSSDPTTLLTLADSAGLTWTQRLAAITSPTSFPTLVKCWTAPVTTGVSMTCSLDCGARSAGMYGIAVVDYTGYDTSTPTGVTATGQQNGGFDEPPTPVTLTLSGAPASTSEVLGFIGIDKSTQGVTPGTSSADFSEIYEPAVNSDWGGMHLEGRTGSASTTVDWDDIRSGGGALFNYAALGIEIRAAAEGGSSSHGSFFVFF